MELPNTKFKVRVTNLAFGLPTVFNGQFYGIDKIGLAFALTSPDNKNRYGMTFSLPAIKYSKMAWEDLIKHECCHIGNSLIWGRPVTAEESHGPKFRELCAKVQCRNPEGCGSDVCMINVRYSRPWKYLPRIGAFIYREKDLHIGD